MTVAMSCGSKTFLFQLPVILSPMTKQLGLPHF